MLVNKDILTAVLSANQHPGLNIPVNIYVGLESSTF